MKTYLCIADGEKFLIQAKSLKSAEQDARLYNGEVIQECPDED